jgi:hypothetical protein
VGGMSGSDFRSRLATSRAARRRRLCGIARVVDGGVIGKDGGYGGSRDLAIETLHCTSQHRRPSAGHRSRPTARAGHHNV